MPELSADNAAEWLSRHGVEAENLQFSELGGGISNKVVLAEGPNFRAVLKQSLGQLRSQTGWNSDRERILREAAAMRWMARTSTAAAVPRILLEDAATFTIAMGAAPSGAEMWKVQLFRGVHDCGLARLVGVTLSAMISSSWHNAEAERLFGDQTVFDQLRIDPYYRFTAHRCPDAAAYIAQLIERSASRRVSLVHGDWSPKNLLVHEDRLWVIDWEVIHYGDPSFDVAFLLNHLLMKSIALPHHRQSIANLAGAFLDGLSCGLPRDAGWIVPAALDHLPALLLARVEGKSPAEYLDGPMRHRAAALAMDLMADPPQSAMEVFTR